MRRQALNEWMKKLEGLVFDNSEAGFFDIEL